jgi:heme/copper-type cytochrome/quinol oxidase subunit 3
MTARDREGRPVVDVAALPDHAFGHHGLIWWGTAGFMVIEGSMFLLVLIAYFYFRLRVPEWPPSLPDPGLAAGTVSLLIYIASCVPNQIAKRAAERYDLGRVRVWMAVCLMFAAAAILVRGYEFAALNTSWDNNAYASITWLLLGLHTSHLVSDFLESTVLAAMVFKTEVDGPRFVDVSENALYWYFVVASWIPIYLTIYFAPRWL